MTKENNKSPSGQFRGGRFAGGPAAIMEEINASIDVDKRLWREDIEGSLAHSTMLVKQGIISAQDGKAIEGGLKQIAGEIESGAFQFSAGLEDIHMNIEARLGELIGEPAGRLHTARSRNDQVATDFRLWCRGQCRALQSEIKNLQRALSRQALAHAGTAMPGFTHLQTAQPITFGHHLLAYVEVLERDKGRLKDAARRMNESPLGAAALAGTSFPVDRNLTAKKLKFARPMANSIDAVSARDFAVEMTAAMALCGVHLSRLAEELILWSSSPFGFVRLSEAFTTGSSIMPQKRNPDAAELCRAKSGQMIGSLNNLLVMLKGLPLAYAKDMQEDKQAVFVARDGLGLCLTAMSGMIEGLSVNKQAMKQAAGADHATATELADYLVRVENIPFREAHHITGRLVMLAEQQDCALADLKIAEMKRVDKRLCKEVRQVLSVDAAIKARNSYGGTAPERVKEQAQSWLNALKHFPKNGNRFSD
jgi:argininosuccinate lyase